MLVELAVTDLGVIAELSLVLPPGMTALTGETGAGKTLVVTAIELLVGGRADAAVVRPGAEEARVEGRFVGADGGEVVLARVVPAEGRSRAYVDGHLAPLRELVERGRSLVDLHGQHAHQSLLAPATQRAALDRFGGVDLATLRTARARVADLDAALASLGGDPRERARAVALLRHQVDEIGRAGLHDPAEDEVLAAEESVLAEASAHQRAGLFAHAELTVEGGAVDAVARARAAIGDRTPYADLASRLASLAVELEDVAAEARGVAEGITEDPERVDTLRTRRSMLADLRRRYGATLAEVMGFAVEANAELAALEAHDERAAALEDEREGAEAARAAAAARVASQRRASAPSLAAAIETNLRELALPRAVVDVAVGEADPGDDVTFLLGANPGERTLPLSKVASGGELARAMLALRLVLLDADADPGRGRSAEGAATLVFDEVDAGIGGEAALAVGRSLAALGRDHQVLVVTHLPQVAAFADAQVVVTKEVVAGRTVAGAARLDDEGRIVEVSRMLSGQPESAAARDHAAELLASAASAREQRRAGQGVVAGRRPSLAS